MKIKFVAFKDLYFPILQDGEDELSKVIAYYVFKMRNASFEILKALIEHEYGKVENLDGLLKNYLRKLELTELVFVDWKGETVHAKATPFPIRPVLIGLLHSSKIQEEDKELLKSWLEGKSEINTQKLHEIIEQIGFDSF